jgi:hypothetical protein
MNEREPLFNFEDVGPIGQVREGMQVVDSAGADVGMVERVKMGDPGAITASVADATAAEELMSGFGSLFTGGLEISDAKARELLRTGFILVDGPGLADMDRFVPAGRIGRVERDTVHLTVGREQLPSAE